MKEETQEKEEEYYHEFNSSQSNQLSSSMDGESKNSNQVLIENVQQIIKSDPNDDGLSTPELLNMMKQLDAMKNKIKGAIKKRESKAEEKQLVQRRKTFVTQPIVASPKMEPTDEPNMVKKVKIDSDPIKSTKPVENIQVKTTLNIPTPKQVV